MAKPTSSRSGIDPKALALAEKKLREESQAAELKEKMELLKEFASTDPRSSNSNVMRGLVREDFVEFYIMPNQNEPKEATHEVMVNGQVFVFPKGRYFRTAKSLVEMLKEYYQIEQNAGEDFRTDRDPRLVQALSR